MAMRPLGSASSMMSSFGPQRGRWVMRTMRSRASSRPQSLHTTSTRWAEENNDDTNPDADQAQPESKSPGVRNDKIQRFSNGAMKKSMRARPRVPFRKLKEREKQLLAEERKELYPRYTEEQKAELKAKYSPEQYESIVAAEEAIVPAHITRGRPRSDVLAPKEFDSTMYARIHPTIDKRIERIRGEWDTTGDKDKYRGDHRYTPDADEKMDRILDILTDTRYNPHDAIDRRREIIQEAIESEKPIPAPGSAAERALTGGEDELDRALGQQLGFLSDVPRKLTRKFRGRPDPDGNMPKEIDESDFEPDDFKVDEAPLEAEFTKMEAEAKAASRADEKYNINADEDAIDEQEAERLAQAQQMAQLERAMAGLDPSTTGPAPKKSTRRRLEDALTWRTQTSPDLAPDIPMINDPKVVWESPAEAEAAEQATGLDDETLEALAAMSKRLGLNVGAIRQFATKTLVNHRVVNQTRLGKIGRTYVLCVAGDGAGRVGLGEGKADEVEVAMRSARLAAIRNMAPVLRYENRTIYGHVKGKVGATELVLRTAAPGFGLRVSGRMYEIARAAGIYDLSGAVTRARNPMNTCKAMVQALTAQRDPDDIARARGKKLVDVRKVYYAGQH